jgi:hypothetical protein
MDDLEEIAEFNTVAEAELAKDILQSSEIEAMIKSDDCGGLLPATTVLKGIKLLVLKEKVEEAKQILGF